MKFSTVEILGNLVGFDTTSRGSNLALIEWVRDYLDWHGVSSRLVADDAGSKANLYATIGPEDVGGVMLSGHTDCVPVDGQDWSSDPFELTERDGRFHARGAADMKGFIAVALAAVPELKARALRRPVHLAFSYDEELGMLGAQRLVAHLRDMPVRPQCCVVGEPTGMEVVVAHKGKLAMTCEVTGLEAHSALTHKGVNAIEVAAEIISQLRRIGARLRAQGPFDAAFDPAWTTVHTGTIEGGIAQNVVPKTCRFGFEFRNLPGVNADDLLAELQRFADLELLPAMRAVHPQSSIVWTPLTRYPSLGGADETPFFRSMRGLCGCVVRGGGGKVSFGTEGGLFHDMGIATVVCGPGFIDQAHTPDEYVHRDQLDLCEQFIADLVAKQCR